MNQLKCAYFKNGMLYDLSPRNNPDSLYEDRDIAYSADIIILDGITYDLSVKEDIASIPIPNFAASWDCTSELSYILKIRCGSEKNKDLIPVFVDKVLSLMQASHMLWRSRDYFQVIRNYYRFGLFSEGDAFEKEFRKNNPHLFNDPAIIKHELEHEQTKRYFKKKYEKRTRT